MSKFAFLPGLGGAFRTLVGGTRKRGDAAKGSRRRSLRMEPLEDRRLLTASFELTAPTSGTVTAGEIVSIQWTASDVPEESKISLCYDGDSVWGGSAENWIEIDGVFATNGSGSYQWDTSSVPAGTYYIAGYLNKDALTVFAHLTTSITIVPSFNLTGPSAGTYFPGMSVPISWTATGLPSTGGVVTLYTDLNTVWSDGHTDEIVSDYSVSNGSGSYLWDTTSATPGNYYIDGYAYWQGYSSSGYTANQIHILTPRYWRPQGGSTDWLGENWSTSPSGNDHYYWNSTEDVAVFDQTCSVSMSGTVSCQVVEVKSGATVTFTSGSLDVYDAYVGFKSTGTLVWNSTGTLTANTVISLGNGGGTGTITQNDGTVVSNGDYGLMYEGNSSVYNLNNDASLQISQLDTYNVTGCHLNFGGTGSPTLTATDDFVINDKVPVNIASTASAVIDTDGYDVTVEGTISGDGSLTKDGLGQLTLYGNNDYDGSISIAAGELLASKVTTEVIGNSEVGVGDLCLLRTRVMNLGNVDLTGVVVDGDLFSAPIQAGYTLDQDNLWLCDTTYAFVAGDFTAGSIEHAVSVTCNQLPEKDSSATFTMSEAQGDLTICLTVTGVDGTGDGILNYPGEVINYWVAVHNNTNHNVHDVVVSSSLTLDKISGDQVEPGVLNVGETWIFTGDYVVIQDDIDTNGGGTGLISNTATVSASDATGGSSTFELPIVLITYESLFYGGNEMLAAASLSGSPAMAESLPEGIPASIVEAIMASRGATVGHLGFGQPSGLGQFVAPSPTLGAGGVAKRGQFEAVDPCVIDHIDLLSTATESLRHGFGHQDVGASDHVPSATIDAGDDIYSSCVDHVIDDLWS